MFYINEYDSEFINEIVPPIKQANQINVQSYPNVHVVEFTRDTYSHLADPRIADFALFTRVVHVTHGEGVIIGIEKKRDDIHVAEVKFDSGTKSKLHLEVVIKMGLLHLA